MLSQREQILLDHLAAIPPDFEAAERYMRAEKFSPDEVTHTAIEYVRSLCFCETGDWALAQDIPHPAEVVPGLHSTYIRDVIRFLLAYGLEPNRVYDEDNIMDQLKFVDNELLAADALALLLEQGGDPNLDVGGESLFESVDFDVAFGAIEQYDRQRFVGTVHQWMVLLGYGGRLSEECIERFRLYDSSEYFKLEMLREHRNYSFVLTRIEKGFAVSIYDKSTLWEVARILF